MVLPTDKGINYLRICYMYIPNNRISKHVRQNLIELSGEIDKSIIVAGVCNTPLLVIDRKLVRM